MKIEMVKIEAKEDTNVILGHSHFIKTAEDLYEVIINSSPNSKFGIAFSEASGPCLIRLEGNDKEMIDFAKDIVERVACGHFFAISLKGAFPINFIDRVKMCPEVLRVICATANPIEVIVAETDLGRAVLGVVDGFPPKGVEKEEDKRKRRRFLREIGYKLE